MQVFTYYEKLLLSSVGVFAISLTLIVIFCVVRKSCWLHKAIWKHDKNKNKVDDIICIRYPPDMYPTSFGVFREHTIRSPEEELSRLFHSPGKRDSTYSSMSETSSAYDLASGTSPHCSNGSNTTTVSSPITVTMASSTPESPEHFQFRRPHTSSEIIAPNPNLLPIERRLSLSQLGSKLDYPTSPGAPLTSILTPKSNERATAAAIAAEAAVAANHRFSMQLQMQMQMQMQQNNSNLAFTQANLRQPFFTFILKYEEDTGLVHIEFIEARNLPSKEYLNQPCDVFFTLEIYPKRPTDRKKEMIRYRFVTKTIKKAGEICDFSETFLVQLSKAHIKEYLIRFSAYDQDKFGNPTEIGTTTMSFDDFRDFTTSKLVLSCSLKESIVKRGEIMVGLCYLPTAERMSVTIVKLANLNPRFSDGTLSKQSICYVRLLLLKSDTGKVVKKKKTTFQKLSGSNVSQPVFNETIVFDMPPKELSQTVLLVLVCLTDKPHRGSRDEIASNVTPDVARVIRHQSLAGKASNESLFHFSGNLINAPKNWRRRSEGSNLPRADGVLLHANGNQINANLDLETRMKMVEDSAKGSPHPDNDTSSCETSPGPEHRSIRSKDSVMGKVPLGYCISNTLGKYHWEQMMRSPRNVVTEWHGLV